MNWLRTLHQKKITNEVKLREITDSYLHWKYTKIHFSLNEIASKSKPFKKHKKAYTSKMLKTHTRIINIYDIHYILAASILEFSDDDRNLLGKKFYFFIFKVYKFIDIVIEDFYLTLLKIETVLKLTLIDLRKSKYSSKFYGFNSKILTESIYQDNQISWKFSEVTLHKMTSLYESIEFNGSGSKFKKDCLFKKHLISQDKLLVPRIKKSFSIKDDETINIVCFLKKLNEYRNIFFHHRNNEFDITFFKSYFNWLKSHEKIVGGNRIITSMQKFLNNYKFGIPNSPFEEMLSPILEDADSPISRISTNDLPKSDKLLVKDIAQIKIIQAYWKNIRHITNQVDEFGYIRNVIFKIESKVKDMVAFLIESQNANIKPKTIGGLANYLDNEMKSPEKLPIMSVFIIDEIKSLFTNEILTVYYGDDSKLLQDIKLAIKHLKLFQKVKNFLHHFDPLDDEIFASLIEALNFFDSTQKTGINLAEKIKNPVIN